MGPARFASRRMFERARQLRRAATPEETSLWEELRGTKLGVPIRRQHPLGTVVVDFYCPRAKVAIELDGAIGSWWLEHGVVVVRFETFAFARISASWSSAALRSERRTSAKERTREHHEMRPSTTARKRVSASSPAGRVAR